MIGVGANPGVPNIDEEIRRFEYKVEAGAEYAVTQPVFDLRCWKQFLRRIEHCRIPVIAGIWPLMSVRNAEFMKNELRVSVPDEIIARMARATTAEAPAQKASQSRARCYLPYAEWCRERRSALRRDATHLPWTCWKHWEVRGASPPNVTDPQAVIVKVKEGAPMRPLVLFALSMSTLMLAQDIPSLVNSELPQLVTTYKQLHQNPELSHQEKQSSAIVADALRKAGYTVTEHVGKYEDGTQAYGVVAVMKNGAGPTVLVRSDMDALPVEEKTGLPYASHARSKNQAGDDVGVMHACGHDIHMATLIGVGETLAQLKDKWHGTLILVGQPSEEMVDGALAMLSDNLYARFGRPDLRHCTA